MAAHTAQVDRTADSGKKKEGGLCTNINNAWCADTTVINALCIFDTEYIMVKCRLLNTPREFSCAFVMAVYNPSRSNSGTGAATLSYQ